MFWTGCISGDEWQVYICLSHAGKLNFCFFSCLFQSLHCHLIAGQVDAVFFLEFSNEVVHQSLVEVIAAQSVVTGSSQNFLNTVAHLDDGNIEGTAAQVVYHDFLVGLFINTVSQSSCGWLVDDTFYIQASNLTSILGCLTLCVCEVSRNGDNCLGNRLTQICLCIGFELLQNHCRDLLWGVGFIIDYNLVVGSHLTFNRADGSVCVGNSLTFCNLTNHSFTGFRESNNGRGGASAFWICDNNRFAAFHNGYAGVCCT